MEDAPVMTRLLLSGAIALIALSAAGCGRIADLDAPPARKTERSLPDAHGPTPREPATVNRPPSQMPIEGGPSGNPYDGPH
jgi:predicted small lipoprotein YifL